MNTNSSTNSCPSCGKTIPVDAPQNLCPACLLAGVQTSAEPPSLTGRWEPPACAILAPAFPHLEILECIGQGGMGAVYKARQPRLDRLVALKILPPGLASDAAFRDRFAREAKVLARLSHPNIVSVHDFGECGGYFFLLLEYVEGANLRQTLQAGRFSPAQALAIVPPLCEALHYAHGEGILHRDIKPENILLDLKGRVKIADFGIAKMLGETSPGKAITATGAMVGTPQYMAPEQIERPQDVDHRADIYSLGVVLYEMLTGELPLGRFAPPSQKTPVDAQVDEVVFRTLEKERERRYQSAGEVKTRVENLRVPPTAGPGEVPNSSPPAATIPPAIAAPWRFLPISKQAAWGFGLTMASLALGLMLGAVVMMIQTMDGVGLSGLALLVCGILPGLAVLGSAVGGNVLGWLALSTIRSAHGRIRGEVLATVAAVAWPLLILNVVLFFIVSRAMFSLLGKFFTPLGLWWVAALLVGFDGWIAYMIQRSVRGESSPPSLSGKKLSWFIAACMGILVFGSALIWVSRQVMARQESKAGMGMQPSEVAPASMPMPPDGAEPALRLSYTVTIPAQQVGLFELVRKRGGLWETVPGFSAFAMAPLSQPRQVDFQVTRDESSAGCTVRVQEGASEVLATGLHWPAGWQHVAGNYADGFGLEAGETIVRALPGCESGEDGLAVRLRATRDGWSAAWEDKGRGLGLGTLGGAGDGSGPDGGMPRPGPSAPR